MSICATLLAVGLFGIGIEPLTRRKRVLVGATVLSVAATVARFAATSLDSLEAVYSIEIAAGLLAGIATGYLLVCWGAAFRELDKNSVALNAAISLLLSVVIYVVILLLDSPAVLIAATLAAGAGEGIICRATQKPLQEESVLRTLSRRREKLRLYLKPSFAKIALVLIIFGFVDSILRELALSTFSAGQSISDSFVGLFLIAIGFVSLFFFVHLVLEARSPIESTYSFATLFVVGVAVTLLFFMNASSGIIYQFVCVVVYLLFDLHVWTLLTHIARDRYMTPSIIYGLGLFFLFVGQFLSPIANGFVASLAQPLQLESVTEPIILMLALLTSVVLLATGSTHDASPFAKGSPAQAASSTDGEQQRKVDVIIQTYLLTEREGDIITMLVKGKSLTKISESLYVSENTTKTHVKNIYRKTGVHSKQELLDLVESV